MELELKPCRVKWRDASHRAGWHNTDAVEDIIHTGVMAMESLGWLVHQSDDCVIIATSRGETSLGDVLVIPSECVLDMWIEAGSNQDG